ncbi:Uncharacterised protein [Mycobacterium tuberculosis]|nr:Uncharacterised protein [Mycobacterium tuberculosis]
MAVDTSSVPAARISVVGAAATAFAALIAEPIPVKYVAVAASASGEAIRNDIRHLQNVRIAKPCRPEHRLASIDPSAQLTIATRGERHPGFPRSPPPSRYPPLADASWRIRPSHSSAVSPAGARPRASRAPAQAHRPGSARLAGRTRRARQGPVVDCRFTRQPPTLTRRDPLKQVGADAQSRCRRRPRRRRRLLVRQGAAWTEMQDGAACPRGVGVPAAGLQPTPRLAPGVQLSPWPHSLSWSTLSPFRASQLGCMCRAAGFVTSGCLAELRAKVDVNREVAVKSRTPRAQCGYPGKSGSGLELPAGAASRYDAVTRVRW